MKPDDVDIKTDPITGPRERETNVKWDTKADRATVHSEEIGIVRRLLRNPVFEADQIRLVDGDITAVWGTLPIGSVKLSANPRKTQRHSKVHARSDLVPKGETIRGAVRAVIEDAPEDASGLFDIPSDGADAGPQEAEDDE